MRTRFQNFVFVFGVLAVLVATYCTFLKKPESRRELYLEQQQISTFYANSTSLNEAIDKRLTYYSKLRGDLNFNRYLVAVVVGLAILLIASKRSSLTIPWVNQEIPRAIALRVLPLLSLYLWLDFGYTLNGCIDSRITAMNLINASLFPAGYKPGSREFQKAHYTISRSSELEDHGLMDTWSWNFLRTEATYVVLPRAWYSSLVPILAMLLFAGLYGMLHTVALYLPTKDVKQSKFGFPTGIGIFILTLAAFTISVSHLNFYYAGRHSNWFQLATLCFAFLFYYLCTKYAPLPPGSDQERSGSV